MKRLILLILINASAFSVFAQRSASHVHVNAEKNVSAHAAIAAKTTVTADTISLSNVTTTDTPTLYYVANSLDSGFLSGTDAYGDMGFAERYDFGGADSSMKVIGVITLFGGKVNPASAKTVTFHTWNAGPRVATSFTHVYNSGFPNTSLNSVTASVTQLGINSTDTLPDTFKTFIFTSPTAFLDSPFFVGYTIGYSYSALAGDTLGLYTSLDGERTSPIYTVSGADTIVNNQSVTMYSDGSWHDNATDNFFLDNDYYIFPIVVVHQTLGVKGITKNNFTFFGNYPNPAVNSTCVHFSLAANADVSIQVMDMAGHVMNTVQQHNLGTGDHSVTLDTSGLPAGDYLYLVRTSQGDGFASKLTVEK